MAGDSRKLRIDVTADTAEVDAKLRQTQKVGDDAGRSLTDSINKSMPGVLAAVEMVAQAYAKVEDALRAVIAASVEHENAMATAAATTGDSFGIVVQYAEELQNQLKIDGDEFLAMAAKIGAATDAQGEQLRGIMQLATQIAGITGQSFERAALQAARFVEKGSGIRGIAIDLTGVTDEAGRLARGLEATTGGMDILTAKAETFSGRVGGINVALDDFNTALGDAITKNKELADVMEDTATALKGFAESGILEGAFKNVIAVFSDIADSVAQTGRLVTNVLRGFVTVFDKESLAGLERFLELLGDIVDHLPNMHRPLQGVNMIMDAINTNLEELFGKTEKVNEAADKLPGIFKESAEAAGDVAEETDKITESVKEVIVQADIMRAHMAAEEEAAAKASIERKRRWREEFDAMNREFDKAREHRERLRKEQYDKDVQMIRDLVALFKELDANGQQWLRSQFPLIDQWVIAVEQMRDPVDRLRDALAKTGDVAQLTPTQISMAWHEATKAIIGYVAWVSAVDQAAEGRRQSAAGEPARAVKSFAEVVIEALGGSHPGVASGMQAALDAAFGVNRANVGGTPAHEEDWWKEWYAEYTKPQTATQDIPSGDVRKPSPGTRDYEYGRGQEGAEEPTARLIYQELTAVNQDTHIPGRAPVTSIINDPAHPVYVEIVGIRPGVSMRITGTGVAEVA